MKCSEDKELFATGVFFSTKGNLNKRSLPCGCAVSPKFEDWQYKILLDRKLKSSCRDFVGFAENFKGYSTKVKIFCNSHNVECCDTPINNILKGAATGCKYCGYESTSKKNKKVNAETFYLNIGLKTGSFIEGTVIEDVHRVKDRTYLNYSCPTCSNDSFVEEGICTGIFKTTQASIYKGHSSCRCGNRTNWTKEERVHQINKRILEDNLPYEFIGFKDEDYKAVSKFQYKCEYHGIQETTCQIFLNSRSGCPSCAEFGYDKNKPAYIYLVKWRSGKDTFCKIGITNNKPYKRISQQSSKTLYKPLHTEEFYHEDGNYIRSLEQEIKQTFKCGVISKDLFPDGFTETVSLEDYTPILKLIKTRMET